MLTIQRVATVVSLEQLAEEGAITVPECGGKFSAPEAKVSDVGAAKLPKYVYNSKMKGLKKIIGSVRSFGELTCLDSDYVADESMSDKSSDTGAASLRDADSSGRSQNSSQNLDGSARSVKSSDLDSVMSEEPIMPDLQSRELMDIMLVSTWEERAKRGLFRYDVRACESKVLPGAFGYIAQLNEGRAAKKRPTEFRVDQVIQEFDDSKFNFMKAQQKEVLFQFEPSIELPEEKRFVSQSSAPDSPHLVFINVSPIEFGHTLLVPNANSKLPQLVCPSTMLLALEFVAQANNPYFRAGYNSLGAYATINHLHFQAYYLAAPFACERVPTEPIGAGYKWDCADTVRVSQFKGYPVRGLVFELLQEAPCGTRCAMADMAQLVGEACQKLAAANQPHNLFIADRGARVFLWPQNFSLRIARNEVPEELVETGVNPACFEIAGHMVMKRAVDYENLSQDLASRLLAECSLSAIEFNATLDMLFKKA